MKRPSALTIAFMLVASCADNGASTSDASTSDAPTLPDPAGTWSCDLRAWDPQMMRFTSSFGRDTVVIARTATGIAWRMSLRGLSADEITLELVRRAQAWSLATPYRPSTAAPDTGGRIDSHDVSWRGDHIWAEEVGVAFTLAGEREFRRAWDCVRAP